jgi:hypothetical protein
MHKGDMICIWGFFYYDDDDDDNDDERMINERYLNIERENAWAQINYKIGIASK